MMKVVKLAVRADSVPLGWSLVQQSAAMYTLDSNSLLLTPILAGRGLLQMGISIKRPWLVKVYWPPVPAARRSGDIG